MAVYIFLHIQDTKMHWVAKTVPVTTPTTSLLLAIQQVDVGVFTYRIIHSKAKDNSPKYDQWNQYEDFGAKAHHSPMGIWDIILFRVQYLTWHQGMILCRCSAGLPIPD